MLSTSQFRFANWECLQLFATIPDASVAQLDRVLGYEPSGRRFESSRMHHLLSELREKSAVKAAARSARHNRVTLPIRPSYSVWHVLVVTLTRSKASFPMHP